MAVAFRHFGERAFKFMRKQPPRENEARQKMLRDLFVHPSPVKMFEHGFPHKPTTIAYDSKLSLMALGTENGTLRIYGTEGVEFSGTQKVGEGSIVQLHFLPGQGRIISVHSDHSIHLWEMNCSDGHMTFKVVRSFKMPNSQVNLISVCCLSSDCQQFYIGTEACSVHILDLKRFQLTGRSLPVEQVMQSAPDDFRKASPGAVEALLESPMEPDRILVGFNRGLIVLWNSADGQIERSWNAGQQQELEAACWLRSGQQFVTSHSDGSYVSWRLDSDRPSSQPFIPYGPFPCKAITKIDVRSSQDDQIIVFAGGMPRSSFGDRHTVSALMGTRQVAFDFGSRVLDFLVLCGADENSTGSPKPPLSPVMNGDADGSSNVCHPIEERNGGLNGNDSPVPDLRDRAVNDSDRSSPSISGPSAPLYDCPHTLLVLCEEEIVAIDLESDGWPQFKLPYIISVHASPVTCVQHASGVSDAFLKRLQEAGDSQTANFSTRKWPITGGRILTDRPSSPQQLVGHTAATRELLLTGHENGCVCFWDLGETAGGASQMQLLYVLHTANLFGMAVGGLVPTNLDSSGISNDDIDEWPPFRKAGVFDPFSDDPRLAIQRLSLCSATETLVVAGMAGQVIVLAMRDRQVEVQPPAAVLAKIVPDHVSASGADGHHAGNVSFVWRGHDPLPVTTEILRLGCGFQVAALLQVYPPAPISAISVNTDWGILAVGTSHGLCVFDYIQKREVGSRCTLSVSQGGESEAVQGHFLSRAKTLKKSLRSSIRRLRQRRSERVQKPNNAPGRQPAPTSISGINQSAVDRMPSPAVIKNEERQIESRAMLAHTDESQMVSLVRCLSLADTYLMTPTAHQPTLWAGTNSGTLLAFSLSIPPLDRRQAEQVSMRLSKELQLRHGAPVLFAGVLDRHGTPYSSTAAQRAGARPVDFIGGHQLLVASEEQIKIFTLPGMKPYGKVKVTARDGSKLRRVAVVDFISRTDPSVHEYAATYVTNLGEIAVYSIPGMQRQLAAQAIPRENVNAVLSTTFTPYGQYWFLANPSQFACYSMSARLCTQQLIELSLPAKRQPALAEVTSPNGAENNSKSSQQPQANNSASVLPRSSPQRATTTANNNNNNSSNGNGNNNNGLSPLAHQQLQSSPIRIGSANVESSTAAPPATPQRQQGTLQQSTV